MEKTFFSDLQYHQSEIYCEQITSGLWIFSLRTEEKTDSCYTYQPKNTRSAYYSINYFETRSAVGYQSGNQIKWTKNLAVFSGPSTTFHIFVQKRVPVTCYRLIFSHHYLKRLLNYSAGNLPQFLSEDATGNVNGGFMRESTDTETITLQKLQYRLTHARSDFNNLLTLTASAFEIANLFFQLSAPDQRSSGILKTDEEVMGRVALELETQILHKFPGINALASAFYISPSKLKKSFKMVYHITPLVYFRKLQMIYASGVLQRREMSVKQLASVLGFKKASTFSVWFKKYTGKFPHEL